MTKKWNIAKFAAIILVLFIVPLSFSETTGNISLSESNQRIVTGLWGITATSTTVSSTATTTTVEIITGGGNTTTTLGNATTTTRITTTTVGSSTASTIGNGTSATTTTLTTFTKENLERAMNSAQITSLIQNNSALKVAIETNIGSLGSSVDPKASEELSKNIWITKILETGGNFSRLSLKVIYNGENPMQNIIIFDKIPKTFAENADSITIETNVQKYVVEADPSFIFVAPLIQKGDLVLIEYSVDKHVGNTILDEGETYLFSGGYKQNSYFMWIAIIAFILSLIFIVVLIFRNQIIDLLLRGKDSKKKYEKKIGFKEALKNAIENLKKKFREKILRQKEKPKFFYEHEEQNDSGKTA